MADDAVFILPDDMQTTVTAFGVDAHGHPSGSFDAAPKWASSDPKLFSAQAAADGLKCLVQPQGELGTGQLSVTGLSGGKEIVKVQAVQTVAGAVVSIGLSAGALEPVGSEPHPDNTLPSAQPVPTPYPASAPAKKS